MLGERFKRTGPSFKPLLKDTNTLFLPLVLGIVIIGILIQTWSARAEELQMRTGDRVFQIDTDTLAIWGGMSSQALMPLSAGGIVGSTTALSVSGSKASWALIAPDADLYIVVSLSDNALSVQVTADRPTKLQWPRGNTPEIEAFALPIFGEGRYIPANDIEWTSLLSEKLGRGRLIEVLSMPFWTVFTRDESLTWLVETPNNADFLLRTNGAHLEVAVEAQFTTLARIAHFASHFTLGTITLWLAQKYIESFSCNTMSSQA